MKRFLFVIAFTMLGLLPIAYSLLSLSMPQTSVEATVVSIEPEMPLMYPPAPSESDMHNEEPVYPPYPMHRTMSTVTQENDPFKIRLDGIIGAIGAINTMAMGWYVLITNRRQRRGEGQLNDSLVK